MGTSRRRLGVILKFVVAAYIAALAALPFAHHDLACHLKSSTHCGVCHVGTSADDTSVQPALGQADLADAGRAAEASDLAGASCVLLPSSGRSPPAATISFCSSSPGARRRARRSFRIPAVDGEEVVVLHSFRVISTGVSCSLAAMCGRGARARAGSGAAGRRRRRMPAQDPQAALRAQIELLRQQLDALQQKVAALEAAAASVRQTPPAAPAAPQLRPRPRRPRPPASRSRPARPAPAGRPARCRSTATPSALSKIFNPDMAVIGNFVGAAGKNNIDPMPALQLNEAEVSFQAIVDPYARADFFLAASPEGLEVEEGFLTFPTLPGGLLMKVGKMKAQFGKVNTMHSHTLPWVDEPLPMQNLLGGDEGLNDSGISVSKLILNPVLFLEATGEIYNGDNDAVHELQAQRPHLRRAAARLSRRDRGHQPRRRHVVRLRPQRRRSGFDDAVVRHRRDVPLSAAAAAPLQDASWCAPSCSGAAASSRSRDAKAFGAYVSGEYQLARRWFAGAPLRLLGSRHRRRRCATRAARCS